ncbi:MAG: hypothetical protein M0Q53_03435 [Prolixibacteraceae bacterium]|jgi:hypothetical protein|nr:hypothetical protein [Prolixibacteraceae bacterium]
MKKPFHHLIFLSIFMVLLFAGSAQAQISVRFNLGSPPQWAPVEHYDARYYYLPDVEAYYDVQSSMFIYYEGRNWVHRSYLPYRYRNYNLYGGYKVPMNNYRGSTPYSNYNEYRTKYSRGRNREYQQTIGQRPQRENVSSRYYRENNQANRGRYDKKDYKNNNGNKNNDRRNERRND